jgi:hypothetical protein
MGHMATTSRTVPITPPSKSNGYGYSLLLVIVNVVLTAVFWWQLPPQIPLFYGLPYGVNQLVAREWFFILPGSSLLIFFGYFLLTRWRVSSPIYVQILQWLHVLCVFLLTVAIVHIFWVTL